MHTSDKNLQIIPRQCKAARALLDWSQTDLAEAAGVHFRTVHDFENGVRKPMPSTLAVLQRALEEGGVLFIPTNGGGPGVRLRDPEQPAAGDSAIVHS
ncbi:MAG: helix-turn-helix transcriptional regulator [Polyangia bacterium]